MSKQREEGSAPMTCSLLPECRKGGDCEWRTDGMHTNEYCGKCFRDKPKSAGDTSIYWWPKCDGEIAGCTLKWHATYFHQDGTVRISADSRSGGIWTVTLCGDGRWQAYLSGVFGERYFGTPREACEYCEKRECRRSTLEDVSLRIIDGKSPA